MIALGIANSRMKDFYDIWRSAQLMRLDGAILSKAIMATSKQRATKFTDPLPFVLSDEFRMDAGKQRLWKAFIQKNHLANNIDFATLVEQLGILLKPVYRAAANQASLKNHRSPEQWQWLAMLCWNTIQPTKANTHATEY